MNPYSGTSTLAKVLRAAAVGGGLVYGSFKLGYLKVCTCDFDVEVCDGTGCEGWAVVPPLLMDICVLSFVRVNQLNCELLIMQSVAASNAKKAAKGH